MAQPVWSRLAPSSFLTASALDQAPRLNMAARMWLRVSLVAAGRQSAPSRRQPAMRWPGRTLPVPYSVWNTDSNGNYLSTTAAMSASSTAVGSFETSFHQDLNGDGVIGVPSSQTSAGTLISGHNNAPGIAANSVAPNQNNSHIVTDSSSIASLLTSDTFKFVEREPERRAHDNDELADCLARRI